MSQALAILKFLGVTLPQKGEGVPIIGASARLS